MTGIASLNIYNYFLNKGIALLSGQFLYPVSKSLVYLSHTEVIDDIYIWQNSCDFQLDPYLYKSTIPLYILSFVLNYVFNYLKSLKLVNYVIYNTYSYFLCFLEY